MPLASDDGSEAALFPTARHNQRLRVSRCEEIIAAIRPKYSIEKITEQPHRVAGYSLVKIIECAVSKAVAMGYRLTLEFEIYPTIICGRVRSSCAAVQVVEI